MRFNLLFSLYAAAVVFGMLFVTGFLLSRHKLVWIDEGFSQHESIDRPSYADILSLRFPDGNKCPLFYVGQKIVSNIFSFHYPDLPAEGSFDLPHARSQIIMRLAPNIYMSLGLAAIFYYFLRCFSLGAALWALAVALVSPMVWLYWVEARPYSLWFLLTTVQLLLFCSTVHIPKIKADKYLPVVHALLALTSPGSILQIFIVAVLLFWKGRFKKRPLIWTLLVPMGIFLFYYILVPEFKIKTFDPLNILFEAVMPERLFVYVIYALTVWGMSQKQKHFLSNAFFLPVFLLFLISGCLMMAMHVYVPNFQFGFFNRYLIYLAPADILMFSLASLDLWQWTRRNLWVCMNVSIFLAGLTVVRGLMTYREILASALYLH